jgi:hypothetical protein
VKAVGMFEHDQELESQDRHAMVGAFATDALSEEERVLFEEHLERCLSCRRESAEFAETLSEASWLDEKVPPPSLRSSVLAEISTVRPLPPLEPPQDATVPRPWPPEVYARPPASSDARYGATPPEELAAQRQRRLRRALIAVVAAALALVVGLGGWVVTLVDDQQNQQVAVDQVNELLTAPDAKVYSTKLHGAPVSFVVSKERDQALFLGDELPPPGENKVYQLWMIGDEVTPNAVIDGGGNIVQWFHTGPLEQARQLAVTIEPAGGSMKPTLPPVAGVEL